MNTCRSIGSSRPSPDRSPGQGCSLCSSPTTKKKGEGEAEGRIAASTTRAAWWSTIVTGRRPISREGKKERGGGRAAGFEAPRFACYLIPYSRAYPGEKKKRGKGGEERRGGEGNVGRHWAAVRRRGAPPSLASLGRSPRCPKRGEKEGKGGRLDLHVSIVSVLRPYSHRSRSGRWTTAPPKKRRDKGRRRDPSLYLSEGRMRGERRMRKNRPSEREPGAAHRRLDADYWPCPRGSSGSAPSCIFKRGGREKKRRGGGRGRENWRSPAPED